MIKLIKTINKFNMSIKSQFNTTLLDLINDPKCPIIEGSIIEYTTLKKNGSYFQCKVNGDGSLSFGNKKYDTISPWARHCRLSVNPELGESYRINGWIKSKYKGKSLVKYRLEHDERKAKKSTIEEMEEDAKKIESELNTIKLAIEDDLKELDDDFKKLKELDVDDTICEPSLLMKQTGCNVLDIFHGTHTIFDDEEEEEDDDEEDEDDKIIWNLKNACKEHCLSVNINEKNGAEKLIVPLLCDGTEIVNEPLYDFVQPDGTKIELKKQQGTQYFDIGKYHNLSEEEKKIVMLFVMHKKGVVKQECYYIELGSFIEICCSDPEFIQQGWDMWNIEMQCFIKKKYPGFQTKATLQIHHFIKKYKNKMQKKKLY